MFIIPKFMDENISIDADEIALPSGQPVQGWKAAGVPNWGIS
jgi:hypothetical protein